MRFGGIIFGRAFYRGGRGVGGGLLSEFNGAYSRVGMLCPLGMRMYVQASKLITINELLTLKVFGSGFWATIFRATGAAYPGPP